MSTPRGLSLEIANIICKLQKPPLNIYGEGGQSMCQLSIKRRAQAGRRFIFLG